jgi:hypothetical protein
MRLCGVEAAAILPRPPTNKLLTQYKFNWLIVLIVYFKDRHTCYRELLLDVFESVVDVKELSSSGLLGFWDVECASKVMQDLRR